MFYSPDLVKSVQIRIYFWSVFSCIPTEYRKIRIRNNSVFGHFSRSDGVGRRMNLMRFKGACSSRVWENNLTKTCTFTSGSSATYTRFKGSLLTSEIKASLLKFFSFFFFFVVTYLIAQEDICDGDIIKVCDDVINWLQVILLGLVATCLRSWFSEIVIYGLLMEVSLSRSQKERTLQRIFYNLSIHTSSSLFSRMG